MDKLLTNRKNRLVPSTSDDDRSQSSAPVELGDDQKGALAMFIAASMKDIGDLIASGVEDRSLVMEVCERVSASPAAAKYAVECLKREFESAEPDAQLSAARLWEIMLRNSSEVFIRQCASHRFVDVLKDVMISNGTSPVVRERLLEVLAGTAYATKDDIDITVFCVLWSKYRPIDKPSEGIPFDPDDPMFDPPNPRSFVEAPDPWKNGEDRTWRLLRYLATVKQNAALLDKVLDSTGPDEDLRRRLRYSYNKCHESYESISEEISLTLASTNGDREESLAILQTVQAYLKKVLQTYQHIEASRYSGLGTPEIIRLLRAGVERKIIVPPTDLFHASCDRLRDAHEGLCIYKQSAGRLVTLWESFVQRCITIVESNPDHGLDADSFLSSLEWYQVLADNLVEWSKMNITSALTNWAIIKEALEKLHRSCPHRFPKIPAMSRRSSMPPSEDLQLGIGETIHTVEKVINSRNHVVALMSLSIQDKLSVVNLFDEILLSAVEDESFNNRIFRTLRKLCLACGSLPRSFYIPSSELSKRDLQSQNFGGFADVWRGQYSGKDVALKTFRIHERNRAAMKKVFYREAVSWKYLSHPNIVPFLGIEDTESQLCMVSVWMPNGSIMSYLKENPASNRMQLLIDVAQGLQYLHSIGVIHGDMKGPNILISDDRRARLIDFGLAGVIHDPDTVNLITTQASNILGTTRWMAPELLDPDQFEEAQGRPSKASDVYALAMVMLEVFSGAPPFGTLTKEAAVIWKVMKGVRPDRPRQAISLGLSDNMWELMTQCWQQSPGSRPPMPRVLDAMQPLPYNSSTPQLSIAAPHPAASVRQPCSWDVCGIQLDDLSPAGVNRHLKEFHFNSTTNPWNNRYRGRCRWGNCSSGDMYFASFGKHVVAVHLREH